PHRHQQENHIIDAAYYWAKRGTVSWRDLQPAIETPGGPLWLNGYSSFQGDNDRVPQDRLSGLTRSLYLVRPPKLTLIVGSEGGVFGPPSRRVRARFRLCGQFYCLVVTDPWMENQCLRRSSRETKLEDVLLCISLGEVFNGFAYKLAAAVITPERASRKKR